MRTFRCRGTLAAAACLFSLSPLVATAQTDATAASAQTGSGPMIVERVKSGFLVAPDFKVTRFDHETSTLAGVYGGWLSDRTLLVGGGGYWLTDRSRTRDMKYGGFVVGWFAHADHRIGYGAKGLIGGGQATLTSEVTILQPLGRPLPPTPFPLPFPLPLIVPVKTTVRVRDDFFIAEPQADVLVHLGKQFRLTGGVGYRLIGGARGSDQRLRGATGSVALQIGGGS